MDHVLEKESSRSNHPLKCYCRLLSIKIRGPPCICYTVVFSVIKNIFTVTAKDDKIFDQIIMVIQQGKKTDSL